MEGFLVLNIMQFPISFHHYNLYAIHHFELLNNRLISNVRKDHAWMKQNNERYRELIKSDPMNWSGTV